MQFQAQGERECTIMGNIKILVSVSRSTVTSLSQLCLLCIVLFGVIVHCLLMLPTT